MNIVGLSIEQMVGIVDTAAWYGDSQSNGLLGLGYPSIDSAHDNQNISRYNFLVDLNYPMRCQDRRPGRRANQRL